MWTFVWERERKRERKWERFWAKERGVVSWYALIGIVCVLWLSVCMSAYTCSSVFVKHGPAYKYYVFELYIVMYG